MKRIDSIILGFSLSGIILCILLSFLFINTESAFMLVLFNLIFISTTGPLDGKFIYKVSLPFFGNILGLFWNYLFFSLSSIGTYHFGSFFDALCAIFGPLTNLIWIVSFWSISLTLLASPKNKGEKFC